MATLIKDLTGPEGTGRWGAGATDLGYPALTNHGYTITVFGDTFDEVCGGAGWRSPTGFRQSNRDIENGIVWDNAIGGDYAKQLISYTHGGTVDNGLLPDGFTNIPNSLLHLPDGLYVMTTFAVRSWASVSPGHSWATFHSRMWASEDTHAEKWVRSWDTEGNHGNFDFPNSGVWSHFQNNSMILYPGEPYVYVFGTNEGRWDGGGIHLMRVDWRKIWTRSAYEFWGRDSAGVWSWRPFAPDVVSTPILMPTLAGNAIGELNAQVIEGRVVLSYLDGRFGAVTRTSARPEGVWTAPAVHVNWAQQPFLYAPAIHPYSRLGRAQMLLSAWTRDDAGDTDFYGVRQWEVDLTASWDPLADGSAALAPASDGLAVEAEVASGRCTGALAPEMSRLPVADQVAIYSETASCELDKQWLHGALQS